MSMLHFACCTCEPSVEDVSAAHCVSGSMLSGSGPVQNRRMSPHKLSQESRVRASVPAVHRGQKNEVDFRRIYSHTNRCVYTQLDHIHALRSRDSQSCEGDRR